MDTPQCRRHGTRMQRKLTSAGILWCCPACDRESIDSINKHTGQTLQYPKYMPE